MTIPPAAARSAMILLVLAAAACPDPVGAATLDRPRDPPRPVAAPLPADERCLALAIYYESGTEPRAGQEAVAQVVLNRVAHPRFPKSVCGVVWQGSERRTGCQFSFTCDGSLGRVPGGRAWAAAIEVARQAMLAPPRPELAAVLNYHADYVRPAWAGALHRVTQIGRHILYAQSPVAMTAMVRPSAVRPAPAGPSVWGLSLAAVAARP